MSVWKGGIKKILAQINPNGGFDVNIQDQTSPLFRYFLIQEQKTNIKLSATAEVNDTVVSGAAVDLINVASDISKRRQTRLLLMSETVQQLVLYGTRVLSLEQLRIMLFRSQLSGQLMYQAQLK